MLEKRALLKCKEQEREMNHLKFHAGSTEGTEGTEGGQSLRKL